jgi:hypothetical protein
MKNCYRGSAPALKPQRFFFYCYPARKMVRIHRWVVVQFSPGIP